MATVNLNLKPWNTPNFALVDEPARLRQDVMKESVAIPLSELSAEALSALAEEWLTELYRKAGRQQNWAFHSIALVDEAQSKDRT